MKILSSIIGLFMLVSFTARAQECTPIPQEVADFCEIVATSKACVVVHKSTGQMAIVVEGDDCLYMINESVIIEAAKLILLRSTGHTI